jgi:Arc/MetJ-type ribon-helix-helix transcriptional regulator
MKVRISATIEKETEDNLNSLLKDGKYRNKSHVIEKAIEILKKKEESEKNE